MYIYSWKVAFINDKFYNFIVLDESNEIKLLGSIAWWFMIEMF